MLNRSPGGIQMRVGILVGCCAALAACSARSPGAVGQVESANSSADSQTVPTTSTPYTLFETLQVRPLALSSDGGTLFALNTPDNRLEMFTLSQGNGMQPAGSVLVGLEPIALAVRNDHEVWVVNHLSDSVSIVRLDGSGPRVVRTLLVGDEPRDIVFAGNRAFITTAHRGQSSPDDPEIVQDPAGTPGARTPGGRADVWVFDTNSLGTSLGGDRLAKLTLFADTPRALAVSADGKTVYAAAFFSGNQTTTVSVDAVRHVHSAWVVPNSGGNLVFWPVDAQGHLSPYPQPLTGLVVKYRPDSTGTSHWLDAYGANFDAYVHISLPDNDVFAIDATATPPVAQKVFTGVGTTLFNLAVNPLNGKIYVSNIDAHNDVRFEGPTPGSVRGKIVDSRITVIDPSKPNGAQVYNNLNSHLTGPTPDPTLSRAFPQDLVVSQNGKQLFVVAQGSAKLAIYNTADLENGTAAPSAGNQVLLSAGGPTGVVVDEKNNRAYVLTRFDNGISVVDLKNLHEHQHNTMFNPEAASVTQGRPFLYDATLTSANGDQACASCHIGGDFDGLAWDLGNPAGQPLPITQLALSPLDIFTIDPAVLGPAAAPLFAAFQPLKGPMTTQSLRGMDNHGGMHWRGDRNGAVQQDGTPFKDASGNPIVSAQPDKGIFDEIKAFESFNVAFPGLVGRADQLTDAQMASFTSFILDVTYPPNPIRALDDSLTPEQAFGKSVFFASKPDGTELPSDRFHNCNGCHVLDTNGNAGHTKHPGFFGTDGKISFENETQVFKVAHLRNLYQKVGRYGSAPDILAPGTLNPVLNGTFPSVRGFGFLHDGTVGDLQHFFMGQVFIRVPVNATTLFGQPVASPNPFGIPFVAYDANGQETGQLDPTGFGERHAIVSYLMAFDSNMKPIVGQQVTLTAANQSVSQVLGRIALLESQAVASHCDLVVRGLIDGKIVGFTYVPATASFTSSRASVGSLTDTQLRALLNGHTDALTFTAVPPGSGWRIGVDRNSDGSSDSE
jgi:DNA-binding beta-propeller fold protein YncE